MTTTAEDHRHIEDPAGHVAATATDLEYFRRKRLEPRVLHLLRRGAITFSHLFDAAVTSGPLPPSPLSRELPPAARTQVSEARIRRAEDALDHLVHTIAGSVVPLEGVAIAIDDTRVERGDYDPRFRIAPREPDDGDLATRLARLEAALAENQRLADTLLCALVVARRTTAAAIVARYEEVRQIGFLNGARLVARAWMDPGFKQRLIDTGRAAARELDIPPGKLGKLGVAENTDEVHNIVVCTLCSCYPHDLLGDPPWWYRTDEYKQRIVTDPRVTIADMFDLHVPDDVTVRVHDSTSDVRWMVLPQRPRGTDHLDEQALTRLITSECLVGAAHPLTPEQAGIADDLPTEPPPR